MNQNPSTLPVIAAFALGLAIAPAASVSPVAFQVPAKRDDAAHCVAPGEVKLQGFLGRRMALNATARLAQVDLEPLLAGFRQKPGVHAWIGEHLGKWLHAATLAWAYTADPELRRKLDYAVAELIAAQEPDGYLGTYTSATRFGLHPASDGNPWLGPAWDVWSHKYCLLGLLTYHQFTGDAAALAASRKAADLLLDTFPGQKSILAAGTHVGMAATSVLEPMVLLYRFTGEPRYLEFCRYLVRSWDEPNGPRIVAALLETKQVDQTANGKAYEMLSNLVGLCELHRVTGEPTYLQAVLNAWQDIVDKRLYLTGSASQGEHFRDDYHLPNHPTANVAETCVTTTWIQFNLQLLRLTGEARFGEELERTLYNHLAAAQRPDGAQWCYFTPLEGRKAYGPGINCCVSSGPRGMALAPSAAAFTYQAGDAPGIGLNLLEVESVDATVDGQAVRLTVTTDFPRAGRSTITFMGHQPARFGLRIRQPAWAGELTAKPAGSFSTRVTGGWLEIDPRTWRPGDTVDLSYSLSPRLIEGTHGNSGRAALAWGPFVLAYDTAVNPGGDPPAALALADSHGYPAVTWLAGVPESLRFSAAVRSARHPEPRPAVLVPFADAGEGGGVYRVWLRAPGSALPPPNFSLLAAGTESRSRQGNVEGSINDGDPGTFVVTFDNRPQTEAWFAVTLPQPVKIGRVVFTQGRLFHDGGWFDASAGKPRVQAQPRTGDAWQDLGAIEDYPATTAASPAGLKEGQSFVLKLAAQVEVSAVRVIGTPASGDNPAQAFASCAELEGFAY